MEIITTNAQETKRLGERLATNLKGELTDGAYVLALNGDLGSGKTTFVQGFAHGLGIATRLPSPTYIIVRRYELKHTNFSDLFHIDVYRLENVSDMTDLGMTEILSNPAHVVLVEWAEKMKHFNDIANVTVNFTILKGDQRRITITHE